MVGDFTMSQTAWLARGSDWLSIDRQLTMPGCIFDGDGSAAIAPILNACCFVYIIPYCNASCSCFFVEAHRAFVAFVCLLTDLASNIDRQRVMNKDTARKSVMHFNFHTRIAATKYTPVTYTGATQPPSLSHRDGPCLLPCCGRCLTSVSLRGTGDPGAGSHPTLVLRIPTAPRCVCALASQRADFFASRGVYLLYCGAL